MTDTKLKREAERRHPNHTYARGKFIEGGRYVAEQNASVASAMREKAGRLVENYGVEGAQVRDLLDWADRIEGLK